MVCQYGEWLKSIGGHPRSPSRMGSAKNQYPSNKDMTKVQNENGSSQVMLIADLVTNRANPTKVDLHAKGKDVRG